ncbi:P-loop NTPase [Halorussus marinus]|uniref:P-loop NTPase n=1 Tax=Halorussus marinus TaxID=2505976 RepID=UPI0010932F82|nr:P-loop NTPase [Halorussus marinus]
MTEELTERVREAIATVDDPDLGTSVVETGLVTDVSVADATATVRVEFAGADPGDAEEVVEEVRSAAFEVAGVERVRVEGDTPEPESEGDATGALDGVEQVLAVMSAKGGVGKTTVATHLARALADDYDVGLFDADIHGPNVPEMLGIEGPAQATDDGLAAPTEVDGIEAMSVGLLAGDEPLAWRGAMAHDALTELLEDTAWSDRDVLVVDMPPGTGDVALTMLQEVAVAGVVLVSTPFPTSLSDTARSAALVEENGVPVVGAAINMRGFECEACGHRHDLYGGDDPESELGVPVLAELPFDRSLQRPDDAAAPDPIAALAEGVADHLESTEAGGVSVPDSALDVRGLPPQVRHEQVGAEFRALDPGEAFYVVNDHDPSPLAELLAGEVADGSADEAFDTCEVHRRGPDEWVLEVERPS